MADVADKHSGDDEYDAVALRQELRFVQNRKETLELEIRRIEEEARIMGKGIWGL